MDRTVDESSMIVTIHQPQYIPWLGYFHKMALSDIFVFLDNVQFVRDKFQHRNKIKTPQGPKWMTVPVSYKYSDLKDIKDIMIDNRQNWVDKHFKTLQSCYGSTPYYSTYIEFFESLYSKEWCLLSDLNIEIIKFIANELGLTTKFIVASELAVEGKKTDLLLNICKALGAHTYISGPSGKSYLDKSRFASASIGLIFHKFNHPIYPQRWGDFALNLSILDLLFNCGPGSKKILLG